RLLPEAEAVRLGRDLVDPETVADRVEVHVAGLGDGRVQVDRPVPLLLPAAEAAPVEDGASPAMDRRPLVDHAGLEAGEGDDQLEGRARRITSLDRAILEGSQRILDDSLPFLAREAPREQV